LKPPGGGGVSFWKNALTADTPRQVVEFFSAQCGQPQIKEIKRQKPLRRAAGRIGEESSRAGRNPNNRQ
jgi:hypothetical protein